MTKGESTGHQNGKKEQKEIILKIIYYLVLHSFVKKQME